MSESYSVALQFQSFEVRKLTYGKGEGGAYMFIKLKMEYMHLCMEYDMRRQSLVYNNGRYVG